MAPARLASAAKLMEMTLGPNIGTMMRKTMPKIYGCTKYREYEASPILPKKAARRFVGRVSPRDPKTSNAEGSPQAKGRGRSSG